MMSNADISRGDRGLGSNSLNLPQTGTQFSTHVKTEPGSSNFPSTSNETSHGPSSASNFHNCQVKTEPLDFKDVSTISLLPIYNGNNNSKRKKNKNKKKKKKKNHHDSSTSVPSNQISTNMLIRFKNYSYKRKADESYNNNQKNSKIKLESGECKAIALPNINASELEMKDEKPLQPKAEELSDDDVIFLHMGASEPKKEDEKPLQPKADELSDDDVIFLHMDASEPKKDEKPLQHKDDDLSDDSSDSEIYSELDKYISDQSGIIYSARECQTTDIGHKCEAILGVKYDNKPRKAPNESKSEYDLSADLLKGKLPPCNIKSVYECNEISCNVIDYEWEKLVDDGCVSRLDGNIIKTVDSVLISEDEYQRILNEVIGDLNDAFSREEFENQWHCSKPRLLYLPGIVYGGSIINLYYEAFSFNRVPKTVRRELATSLSNNNNFKLIRHNSHWIHLYAQKSGIGVRISFLDALEVRCSLLENLYLSLNPNLKYLIVYVELILRKYRVHWSLHISSSHIVFWLVVFFMQQKKLLPAVIDVRKASEVIHYVSGWDCSLPEDYSYPTEPVSLYSLLLGFFNFYKDFNFLNFVICPYLGRVLPLADIEQLRLCVDEFGVYLRQVRNPDQIPFTRGFLNVQDPTDLSRNLGSAGTSTLNAFKIVCHHLNELLPNFLTEIQQMYCLCEMLPPTIEEIDSRPRDFMKYQQFVISVNNDKRRKKLNQCHVLEAVRRLMEFVFRLKQNNIVIIQNGTEVRYQRRKENTIKKTFPILHFEYCSTESTWQSSYMKNIIPQEESIRIYLRCEVRLQKHRTIQIFAQSNAVFMNFLRNEFENMFMFVLNKMFST